MHERRCEIVPESAYTQTRPGGTETVAAAVDVRRTGSSFEIVINLSSEQTSLVVLAARGQARRGEARLVGGEKKGRKTLSVLADFYNMLHASFGLGAHAKPKGCFGKTKSHTARMRLTQRM